MSAAPAAPQPGWSEDGNYFLLTRDMVPDAAQHVAAEPTSGERVAARIDKLATEAEGSAIPGDPGRILRSLSAFARTISDDAPGHLVRPSVTRIRGSRKALGRSPLAPGPGVSGDHTCPGPRYIFGAGSAAKMTSDLLFSGLITSSPGNVLTFILN